MQQSPQALQCAELATFEGSFTDAQDSSCLRRFELLEMPKDQDLAVVRGELGKSSLNPAEKLAPNYLLAGADAGVDQSAGQQG